MTDWPIIDITEVYPEAVKVEANTVEPGDLVFDVYGGRHQVTQVRPLKSGTTKIMRDDGWPIWLDDHDLITIVRKTQ